MPDFEKLGAFYIGRRYDTQADRLTDELTLYDSADLTTHAVIIGMTGSGKTGLGIGLIEEAALDHIPVIAIDPKGDLGNLLLSFPRLAPADFEPWVDPRAATSAGQTIPEFAAATARLWKNGLADWGQQPDRIARLHEAVDMALYTPGSTAGRPVSVLREFTPPTPEQLDDADLCRERVQGTATSILTLLDIDADPLTSREHILLANVLDHAWRDGRTLDLATLITAIQAPGFDRIGVMDLETFYPAKERFALTMRLNNLLAAPGFDAWMQGVPLAADRLLHSPSGKPRVSIMSIAHLDDNQRMFFVTMLLAELLTWMRRQPGSSSLRAILYMDEVFGYMPPVANPPAKRLLLTLLKQARAFGVGVVLSTQNPVDLDYKGLSNTGTWFIGRLQTERDKARVRDGLAGATAGSGLDGTALERTLSGLGKRRFLLHNVHENAPVIFQTRWVMSYLAGPLTRDQIRRLTPAKVTEAAPAAAAPPVARPVQNARPALAPDIRQYFVPPTLANGSDEKTLIWHPRLVAAGNVRYTRARPPVDVARPFALALEADTDARVDWALADPLELAAGALEKRNRAGGAFAECPAPLTRGKNHAAWEKSLRRWLRTDQPLVLWKSKTMKATSEPGESEGEFRARLQRLGNETRDRKVAQLRKRYEKKVATVERRLLRAQQAVEREQDQAVSAKADTVISFGTAILGALLGRKRVSVTSASRVGTAARKAGRARTQAADVGRARQTVAEVREQLATLEAEFDADVAALDDAYDAQTDDLDEIAIRAKSTDIDIRAIGVGWFPYLRGPDGVLTQAY